MPRTYSPAEDHRDCLAGSLFNLDRYRSMSSCASPAPTPPPYNPDLSPFYPYPDRRHPTPRDGWFILPANALLRHGIDEIIGGSGAWSISWIGGETVKADHVAYPAVYAWARAIKDDPTLYAAMQEYALSGQTATSVSDLAASLAKVASVAASTAKTIEGLTRQVEQMKRGQAGGAAEKPASIKVGDWLVCVRPTDSSTELVRDNLYRCRSRTGASMADWIVLEGDCQGHAGWYPNRFRLATSAEIAAHLIKEGEIKVGDWVVCLEPSETGYEQRLVRDHLYRARSATAERVSLEGDLCTTPWKVSRFRKATPAEVASHLAKVAAEKALAEQAARVTVTVEGKDYVADYRKGYVQFGCAQIDNRHIREAHHLCSFSWIEMRGNRQIEAVQIGKGLFTRDILARLMPNLID